MTTGETPILNTEEFKPKEAGETQESLIKKCDGLLVEIDRLRTILRADARYDDDGKIRELVGFEDTVDGETTAATGNDNTEFSILADVIVNVNAIKTALNALTDPTATQEAVKKLELELELELERLAKLDISKSFSDIELDGDVSILEGATQVEFADKKKVINLSEILPPSKKGYNSLYNKNGFEFVVDTSTLEELTVNLEGIPKKLSDGKIAYPILYAGYELFVVFDKSVNIKALPATAAEATKTAGELDLEIQKGGLDEIERIYINRIFKLEINAGALRGIFASTPWATLNSFYKQYADAKKPENLLRPIVQKQLKSTLKVIFGDLDPVPPTLAHDLFRTIQKVRGIDRRQSLATIGFGTGMDTIRELAVKKWEAENSSNNDVGFEKGKEEAPILKRNDLEVAFQSMATGATQAYAIYVGDKPQPFIIKVTNGSDKRFIVQFNEGTDERTKVNKILPDFIIDPIRAYKIPGENLTKEILAQKYREFKEEKDEYTLALREKQASRSIIRSIVRTTKLPKPELMKLLSESNQRISERLVLGPLDGGYARKEAKQAMQMYMAYIKEGGADVPDSGTAIESLRKKAFISHKESTKEGRKGTPQPTAESDADAKAATEGSADKQAAASPRSSVSMSKRDALLEAKSALALEKSLGAKEKARTMRIYARLLKKWRAGGEMKKKEFETALGARDMNSIPSEKGRNMLNEVIGRVAKPNRKINYTGVIHGENAIRIPNAPMGEWLLRIADVVRQAEGKIDFIENYFLTGRYCA